ncbi:polysaccharide deacetylase family protein [Halomarina salina]|uniref:Polysaccharide deacetylase family protein n=1 Tax=Halomarina salina TaxID=1872699 RepID=A0ABD5RPR3_9EURY|nr:polysaccharide deacetylase family protein [Halomarina salina]
MAPKHRVRRRAFLGTVGAAFVGLAGCSDDSGPSETETRTGSVTSTPTSTPENTATPTPDGTPTETQTPAPQQPPAWMASEGEQYTDFADLEENWQVQSGEVALVDNEGFLGGPAVRMTTGDGGVARMERRYYQPIDFSGREFSIAVKLEATEASATETMIRVQDINGRSAEYTDIVPSEAAGEWLRVDAGASSPDPVDLSQVTRIRVQHYGLGDNASRCLVSDLRTHPGAEKGTVVFAFEGDHENSFSLAYPVLNEAGYAAGVFLAPDNLGGSSTPTSDDYQTMQSDGWDVGPLTLGRQRLTSLGGEERQAVEGAVSQLNDQGFDGATNVFRPPRGSYTAETLGYADDLFDLTFVGVGGSLGSNTSLSDTRTVLSVDADDLSLATDCVEAAAEHRQVAMLVFTTRHLTDRAAFSSLVDRVSELESSGDVDVVTPTELASRYD